MTRFPVLAFAFLVVLGCGGEDQPTDPNHVQGDRTPPVQSEIRYTIGGNGHVLVTWRTDEPARGRVFLGLADPPDLEQDDDGAPEGTSHSVALSGFYGPPRALFYLQVQSADTVSNWSAREPSPPDTFRAVPSMDREPPVVQWIFPQGGQHSGTIELRVMAWDRWGVEHVEFSVDGNPIGTVLAGDECGDREYCLRWDTATVVDGTHSFYAIVVDWAGIPASVGITASVDNQP